MSRYLVLLSDCLLYCYYTGLDHTKLRLGHTLPIEAVSVQGPGHDDPHPTEFKVISNVASFIVKAK